MAKKTIKGKPPLICDFDKKEIAYKCSMLKNPTGLTLPKDDFHRWTTEAVKFYSEVDFSPPYGIASAGGGTLLALFPPDIRLECETGLKMGRFNLTECTFKR